MLLQSGTKTSAYLDFSLQKILQIEIISQIKRKLLGQVWVRNQLLIVKFKNCVMSQTAGVLNGVSEPHIPKQNEDRKLEDVGNKLLVITCTV